MRDSFVKLRHCDSLMAHMHLEQILLTVYIVKALYKSHSEIPQFWIGNLIVCPLVLFANFFLPNTNSCTMLERLSKFRRFFIFENVCLTECQQLDQETRSKYFIQKKFTRDNVSILNHLLEWDLNNFSVKLYKKLRIINTAILANQRKWCRCLKHLKKG